MELICQFPQLPLKFNESGIICFYGEIDLISKALSELLQGIIQVDEGFNFYSTKSLLIVTFSTNNLHLSHQLHGLRKLSKISENIVYAINIIP